MQPFVGYAEDGLPVAVVDDDSAIRIRLTAAFQGPSK
jgi:hypothetical protein